MKTQIDSHTHSLASVHAYSTIKENAEMAAQRGLRAMAVTDHAPGIPGSVHEQYFGNMKAIPQELFGVRILSGAELSILNKKGDVDLPEKVLRKLDVVIASIHSVIDIPKGSDVTEALLNVMENPYVKIIGHPGDPNYPFDEEAVAMRAARKGVALEINERSADGASSSRAGSADILRRMIPICAKHGTYLTLGSDAHFYTLVGGLSASEAMLYKLGFPDEMVLNYDLCRFLKFVGF